MAVAWSDDAIEAVARIRDRIEAFAGQDVADSWLRRLSERVHLAEFLPFASREVPEFKIPTLREVFEGDYRVIYRVVPDGIEVVIVFHGAMELNDPKGQ